MRWEIEVIGCASFCASVTLSAKESRDMTASMAANDRGLIAPYDQRLTDAPVQTYLPALMALPDARNCC